MKRKEITIFFTNNGFLLQKNKQILKYQLSSVDNYKVINSQKFTNELIKILKENKINNRLINDNLILFIDNTYKEQDKSLLEFLFKDLSFNKITFINWLTKIKFSTQYLLVNISYNVAKIYYYDKVLQIPIFNSKYVEILEAYIKVFVNKYKIKSVRLFGENEYIHKIRDMLEQRTKFKIYVYSEPVLYPLNVLI